MISVLAGQVAAKYIKTKNKSVTCSVHNVSASCNDTSTPEINIRNLNNTNPEHKYCKYVGSVDEKLAAYDMARFLLSHGSTPEGALASMLAHS